MTKRRSILVPNGNNAQIFSRVPKSGKRFVRSFPPRAISDAGPQPFSASINVLRAGTVLEGGGVDFELTVASFGNLVGSDPYKDLDVVWDFGKGGVTPFNNFNSNVTGSNDSNEAQGLVVATAYESAGSYTVTATLRDRFGATRTVSASSPAIVTADSITWDHDIAVSFDGSSGAPAGATQISSMANLATALSAVNNGESLRLRFRAGEVFTDVDELDIEDCGLLYIGAWGTGARPILRPVAQTNDWDQLDMIALLTCQNGVIEGIEFDGLYDPDTGTSTNAQVRLHVSGCDDITVHNCKMVGCKSLNAQGDNASGMFVSDCDVTDWYDYGILGNVSRLHVFGGWALQSTGSTGADGKNLDQNPDFPDHGPLRMPNMSKNYIGKSAFRSHNGWSGPGVHQPCIRALLGAGEVTTPWNFNLDRCALEGGATAVAFATSATENTVTGVGGKAVVRGCYFEGDSQTSVMVSNKYGGLYALNNLMVRPNTDETTVTTQNFSQFFSSGNNTEIADSLVSLPCYVMGNTLIQLQDASTPSPDGPPDLEIYRQNSGKSMTWNLSNNIVQADDVGNVADFTDYSPLDAADAYRPTGASAAIGGAVGETTIRDYFGALRPSPASVGASVGFSGSITSIRTSSGFAPMGAGFVAAVTSKGSLVGDPQEWDYQWNMGKAGTPSFLNISSDLVFFEDNANAPRGNPVGTTYLSPGPVAGAHAVSCVITDQYGNSETITGGSSPVVLDPAATSTDETIVVAFDDVFTGAPTGTQCSTDTELQTALGNIGDDETFRIFFKAGDTFAGLNGLTVEDAGRGYIGTWGSGARPILRPADQGGVLSNWNFLEIHETDNVTVEGLEFDGLYDPATGLFTNARARLAIDFSNDFTMHNCNVHGCSLIHFKEGGTGKSGGYFSDNIVTAWYDYGLLTNCADVFLMGGYHYQDEDVFSTDTSNTGTNPDFPDAGPFRSSQMSRTYATGWAARSHNGWNFGAGGTGTDVRSHQPCVRLNATEGAQTGWTNFFDRCYFEGGVNPVVQGTSNDSTVITGTAGTVVFSGCDFLGDEWTRPFIGSKYGGVYVLGCRFVRPDVTASQAGSFNNFISFGDDSPIADTLKTKASVIRGNTFVSLLDSSTTPADVIIYEAEDDALSDVTVGNNILHIPDHPNAGDFTDYSPFDSAWRPTTPVAATGLNSVRDLAGLLRDPAGTDIGALEPASTTPASFVSVDQDGGTASTFEGDDDVYTATLTAGAGNVLAIINNWSNGSAGETDWSATYGGQAMTKIGSAAEAGQTGKGTTVFFLEDPGAGAADLVVTRGSGAPPTRINFVLMTVIGTAVPVDFSGDETNVNPESMSTTVEATSNDMVVSTSWLAAGSVNTVTFASDSGDAYTTRSDGRIDTSINYWAVATVNPAADEAALVTTITQVPLDQTNTDATITSTVVRAA